MASCTTYKFFFVFLSFSHLAFAIPDSSLKTAIQDAARRANLDVRLIEAVIKVESNFNPNATSVKGAKGLMQVMDATADECGIHDAYHSVNNIMGASKCLRRLINRYSGNIELALAAYNAGPKAVEKYQGIPPYPETENYVRKIMKLYRSP